VREELARVADAHGWGEEELVAVQRNAADAAFVEPSRRAELRRLVTHM
jgi:adenosine deaminase